MGLKLNIQKIKIMAYDPIPSRGIDGVTMETVTDFIFLGFKTTADGDCSHEIKRHLLLARKAMTNLGRILQGLLTNLRQGFPGGSDGKVSACNARDPGLIPELGRYPGERNGTPLQYSCLENPMDGEAW